MPLSPDDLLKVSPEDEAKIKEVEEFIDSYLLKNYNGGMISIPIKWDLKPKLKNEIVKDYKNVGWNIVYFKHGYGQDLSLDLGKISQNNNILYDRTKDLGIYKFHDPCDK